VREISDCLALPLIDLGIEFVLLRELAFGVANPAVVVDNGNDETLMTGLFLLEIPFGYFFRRY